MTKDIDTEIVEWSMQAFPDLTMEKQLVKLSHEFRELIEAIISKNENNILEEFADVYIVSCILKKRFNDSVGGYFLGILKDVNVYDIKKAVKEKMEKNRKRRWTKLNDGTYQHK